MIIIILYLIRILTVHLTTCKFVRFNELRRQISSGVERTANKWMSAMQLRTAPKGDLPHYSYIFRKSEPLVIEMKNMA